MITTHPCLFVNLNVSVFIRVKSTSREILNLFCAKNIKNLTLFLVFLTLSPRIFAMGGSVPSGYPSSFIMGMVDDDFEDNRNSYGLGVNAEVNRSPNG